MSWSSDWVYGWNDASWLGASIASAEKAKLQAKHMAIGGDGNYHAICTFDDNILLRRRVSKASWKKVTPPPLNGASIVNITIHSTEFDFQQFDIMDGAVSPMALAVVTDDARVLMLAYEADTQLRSSGWKEVMYGPQGVPITDDNRLRARMVSIGNLDQSEGYLTPLVGMLDDDGMPVVLCPRKFSDVKGGEPAPYAKRLWGDVPSRKLACGNSLVVGIDADGSVWGHGVESMPQGACSMHHGGETWFENTFEKSGVEVVDIDAYGRDVAAVTSDGMIHCWTRDYGMLHGIYDAKGSARESHRACRALLTLTSSALGCVLLACTLRRMSLHELQRRQAVLAAQWPQVRASRHGWGGARRRHLRPRRRLHLRGGARPMLFLSAAWARRRRKRGREERRCGAADHADDAEPREGARPPGGTRCPRVRGQRLLSHWLGGCSRPSAGGCSGADHASAPPSGEVLGVAAGRRAGDKRLDACSRGHLSGFRSRCWRDGGGGDCECDHQHHGQLLLLTTD